MGLNQSLSCHAASSCSAVIPSSAISSSTTWAAPYTGSIKNSTVVEPCAVAKVLLLDGRILHFTGSITALQVLASFHHHCLCPLDSVSHATPSTRIKTSTASVDDSAPGTITTFFRPVCLHPNDLLRPNCVYILLPRRTFRLFAAAAAAATRNRGVHAEGIRGCSAPYKTGSKVSDSAYCQSTGPKLDCESHKQAHQANDKLYSCAPNIVSRDTNTVASYSATCGANPIDGTPQNPARTGMLSTTSQTKQRPRPNISSAPYYRSLSLDLHRTSGTSQSRRRQAPSMRRCRSWRPRLEAINEVQAFS